MTPRQQQLLRFIQGEVARTDGIAPTLAEIVAALNWRSPSTAHRVLTSLERGGLIRRDRSRARGITLAGPAIDLTRVPYRALLSEVARRVVDGAHPREMADG